MADLLALQTEPGEAYDELAFVDAVNAHFRQGAALSEEIVSLIWRARYGRASLFVSRADVMPGSCQLVCH